MSATGLNEFDSTLQKTHVWLNDIMDVSAGEMTSGVFAVDNQLIVEFWNVPS
jgi:hypothetical protein